MNLPTRREVLKIGAGATGAAALPASARGDSAPPSFDEANSVLYDATRCIGCRACARRCREVTGLPPDPHHQNGMAYDVPRDLSPNDWMILQACEGRPADPHGAPRWSFLKRNCMHCNIPACASACPVAALQKTDRGPVVYHADRCIGCRYCLLACPYEVPRYEWLNRMPRVRKCNLNGACVKACPAKALVDGKRKDLIEEAHARIHESPERYYDHLYGEHEGGGTSYMILSALPFEELGLPVLPSTARSSYADAIMAALPGWIIGLGLFLGGLYQLDKRQRQVAREQRRAGPGSETEA
jgi:Fe-S-cluster-containing dehydrogenase component